MSLDPSSSIPLYQQVAAHLRQQIVAGEIAVGTQLRPHRQLATHYGVSIMTINKALAGLVSEGVLHSRVGRGTFVAVRPAPPAIVAAKPGRMLGFVLRDMSSPFFSLIAHAAQQAADAAGYALLFSSSSNRADREEEQIGRFRELGVEGLIIVSMSRTYRLSDSIRALDDVGLPFVMVSYIEGDDVPFIGLDLDRAGYLAGQHLVAVGHRKFGYVGDKFGSIMFQLRGGGFRRAVEEHGFTVDPAFTFEYPYEGEWNDYRSGYAVGQHVATLPVKPDAMFAHNDIGALGFQDGLLASGLRVPHDIAVVGLDDIELAARARVPLTTIKQPTEKIGAMAVDYILARLRGEILQARHLLVPEIIVRRSCGAAGDEPERRPRSRALHSLKDRTTLVNHG
jgi:DNA-binding LacI/PurR family transcriptional regulator